MTPLEHLLDQTRDALRSGDFAALSGLDGQLAVATQTLPRLDAAAARRLQYKAERNARLLQAAGRGLRAARDRMAEISSGPGLAIYDAQGRKATLVGPDLAIGRF